MTNFNSWVASLADAGTISGNEYLHLVQGGNSVRSKVGPLIQKYASQSFLPLSSYTDGTHTIDPTGLTDNRDALNSALQAVQGTNTTLLWDCPIYANIGTNPAKPIFVDSNTNVLFTPSGLLQSDNLALPMFVFNGTTDCVWDGFNHRYCAGLAPSVNGQGDAFSVGGIYASTNIQTGIWNTTAASFVAYLQAFLVAKRGNTFTGGATPKWSGPFDGGAVFMIRGASSRLKFRNATFQLDQGLKACYFLPLAFEFGQDWNAGVTGITTSLVGNASTPSEIEITDGTIDGCMMGILGSPTSIRIDNLHGIRYTDMQDQSGNNFTSANSIPPPHLVYIQGGGAFPGTYDITHYYDEGVFVGAATRRSSTSGSALSCKVEGGNRTLISGYYSGRPDGIMDFEVFATTVPNVTMENFVGTFDSSCLTNDGVNSLWGLRFPGPVDPVIGLIINGMTLIDLALVPTQWPFANFVANNCSIKNLRIFVNDYPAGASYVPGFVISGDKISFDAEIYFANFSNFTATKGSLFNSSARQLTNSKIRIKVFGWRQFPLVFTAPPSGTSGTLSTNWGGLSGTYLAPLSDGEWINVTLANGANTASWPTTITGIATTAASGTGAIATLNFSPNTVPKPMPIGATITVAGVTPTGYNGTYVITDSTKNSVSFANTTTGAQSVAGTISPSTVAIAGGALAANIAGGSYTNYKQTIETMQGGLAYGTEVTIEDVSNNWVGVQDLGSLKETWTQMWTGTPPSGGAYTTPMAFPTTMSVELITQFIKTTLGNSNGLTSQNIGSSGNASMIAGAGRTTTQTVSPVIAPATLAGSNGSIILTPVGGTYDGTGLMRLTVKASQMLGGS